MTKVVIGRDKAYSVVSAEQSKYQGPAGTIAVGIVTTGASVSITNVGTASSAILNFVVPIGPTYYEFWFACSDETSDLSAGAAKITFRNPFASEVIDVRLNTNTAPTDSSLIVDINENGTSIFSTNPRINSNSRTSVGSSIPYVFSDPFLADDSEITIDLDQVGITTKGKGLKVCMYVRRT